MSPPISPLKFFDNPKPQRPPPADPRQAVLHEAAREIKAAMRIPPLEAEWAAEVLLSLASGRKIEQIGGDPMFPPYWVINRWRREYPEFDTLCQEAIDAFADKAVFEMVEVADQTEEHPASRSVRIDARLKAARLLNRVKYGDHKTVASDPSAPLVPASSEALDARIAALLSSGADIGQED